MNDQRPTPTWQLWLVGLIGGTLVAVWIFLSADPGTDASVTAGAARNIGSISIMLLLLTVAVGGGWQAISRQPTSDSQVFRWVLGGILFVGGALLAFAADHDSGIQAIAFWVAVAGALTLARRDFLPAVSNTFKALSNLLARLVGGVIAVGLTAAFALAGLALSLACLYFLVRFIKWAWTN